MVHRALGSARLLDPPSREKRKDDTLPPPLDSCGEARKSSYLLVGLLLRGLLGGDRLLRAALLEHRLRDDGLALLADSGRHGCEGVPAFEEQKRE